MSGPLKAWINFTTPRARNMVRNILANSNAYGMSTQEIYSIAINTPGVETEKIQRPPRPKPVSRPPEQPNPDHPIRSMRYLKKFVLEDLMGRNEVVKVHVRRGAGGEDEQGNKLDLVKAKGMQEVSAPIGIQTKEAWLWRLAQGKNALPDILEKEDGPIPRVGPMVPDDVDLEEGDVDVDPFGGEEGWTKERLRFINVPVVDTRSPDHRKL